ncbi:YezD family protein [Paenibacillus sp. TAB 01]|uniref:YezD family protein n=1 Tax=Paenibacillus sp. TAB 01 TaxID=3368988 RepID=UPI003753A4A1
MAKPLEVDTIWSQRILNSVNGLEYGTVQIVVHDGRIVQIERTERKRFESEAALRDRDSSDGKPQHRNHRS